MLISTNMVLDYCTRVLALVMTSEGVGLAAVAFFLGMLCDYSIRH